MKNENGKNRHHGALVLGVSIILGLGLLGYFVSNMAIKIGRAERTVTVKGLSQREVSADIAIWPIKFSETENDLMSLYTKIENKTMLIDTFLKDNGFSENEISKSTPTIMDRHAQGYVDSNKVKFRYSASIIITVYTKNVVAVRNAMCNLVELGKKGIVIVGPDYQTKTEFLFTKLNEFKPSMIEEATKNAREVAKKFARDSNSVLGKIKHARQGQFSIQNRDSNTPHIKKVRVVSTVEYYLTD